MAKLDCLNVGCGNMPIMHTDKKRWVNFDKYYYPGCQSPNLNHKLAQEFKGIWKYGDMIDMKEYPSDYYDEVICVHALEHVSMEEGNRSIKEMVRVCKPGGFVEIEVPNLTTACKLLPTVKFNLGGSNHKWFRIMGLLYGDTGKEGVGQYHLCGYTKNYLRSKMKEHKLKNIKEVEVGFAHGRPEPQFDFRLRGYK